MSCHSSAKFEGWSNKLGQCEVVLDGFLYLFAKTLNHMFGLRERSGREKKMNKGKGKNVGLK